MITTQTETDRVLRGLLENKVAIVTGASRGIGAAAACAFAEAAAAVVVAARDEQAWPRSPRTSSPPAVRPSRCPPTSTTRPRSRSSSSSEGAVIHTVVRPRADLVR